MLSNRRITITAGQRFGQLTATGRTEYRGRSTLFVEVICDCGSPTRWARWHHLSKGCSRSCGCGVVKAARAHGEYNTHLYQVWADIKQRCLNPKNRSYGGYGGRGITICGEWAANYEAFRDWALTSGFSDDLQIERKNNNGNYEPSNCKWATRIEQANNVRSNQRIEHDGVSKTIAEWARCVGISHITLRGRLASGWSVADALSKPARDASVHHNGITMSVGEWARTADLPYRVLVQRIRAGWDMERALSTPHRIRPHRGATDLALPGGRK